MSDHDLARQIAAMRTELREVRRLVHALLEQRTTTAAPPAVITGDDGRMFLPGTGWIDAP